MRKVLALVISFLCTSLMCVGVIHAEDNPVNINYNAQSNEFSFEEYQDLFVNLKNVVPGDDLIQKIDLEVMNLKKGEKVNIYLQAKNPNEDYSTLTTLTGVNLRVESTVEETEGEKKEIIQEKIGTPLLIGSFPENEEVNIEVHLVVDKTVGNEIANLDADIDWVFTAEIIENTNGPKTGDDSNVGVAVIACIISLGVICFIMLRRKENPE